MLRCLKASALTFSLLLQASAPIPADATKEDSWKNLEKVTRARAYTVADRKGFCAHGGIQSLSNDSITITIQKGDTIRFERTAVIHVTALSGYIIYSGRSSWQDVRNYMSAWVESVTVTTKNGATHTGKIDRATDAELKLTVDKETVTLPKDEVATVKVISFAPLSESNEYWAQECAVWWVCVLNPALWPRLAGKGAKLRVTLFDSSLPEDNSPECSAQH